MPDFSLDDPHQQGSFAQRAIAVVQAVAGFIREERARFSQDDVETKGTNDLVSYVDRGAEARLSEQLGQLLPQAGYIMEESGRQAADRDWVWIIDPLDGTTNFVHNVPLYCISVGLQFDGVTQFGIVLEVNRGELFWAQRGHGAYLGSKRLKASPRKALINCLIATGFPFRKFGVVREYMQMLEAFMRSTRGIRRLGSAALDLAYTAAGRFDGFFESNLSPWDVAAGALLVQEAGGTVSDYKGGDDFVFGRTILAAGQAIHGQMLEVIQQHNQA